MHATSPKRPPRFGSLRTWLKIAVSIVLLAYVIQLADWGEARRTLGNADLRWLVLFVCVLPLTVGTSVWKWSRLLNARGRPVPFGRLYGLYVLGQFYTNVLPSSVGGDVVRGAMVKKDVGSLRETVGSIAAERLTGMTVLAALGAAAVLSSEGIRGNGLLVALAGVSVLAGLVILAVLFATRANAFLPSRFTRVRVVRGVLGRFHRLQETLHGYRSSPMVIVEALGLSALFYGGTMLSTFVACRAVGEPVPFATVLVALPIVHLVGLLPVSLNGIGLKEWAFTTTFAALGVPPTVGLIVALLLRVRMIAWSGVGYAVWTMRNAAVDRRAGEIDSSSGSRREDGGRDASGRRGANGGRDAAGRPRSHRVLLAGIDGSGKSSCLDTLISRFERGYTVTKIVNRDASIERNGERRLAFRWLYERLESMRSASLQYRLYGVFLAVKFLYKVLVIKYVLRRDPSDLTMFEIDLLLHPAVYVTYHFPFSRWIGRPLRFRLVSMLTGTNPDDSVFYLETDPDVAMERIRRRGLHLASHENVQDLTALKEEFDRMIEARSEPDRAMALPS